MMDWRSDLSTALASGNPEFMKAMLGRVPPDVLQQAIPILHQQANACEKDGKLEESLTYYDYLLGALPGQVERHADRARVLLKLQRFAEALADAEQIVALEPMHPQGYCMRAEACEGLRDQPQALSAFRHALSLAPDDEAIAQRIHALETDLRKEAVLRQALDPNAPTAPLNIELPPPPTIVFDPVLFDDPSIPESFDSFRVEGLKQHLWRYSGQLSPRNTITRLEDPVWLAAWDAALSTTAGTHALFWGSELGVFALRALHHGAAHVRCVETFPLDARITTGMVQKHLLAPWLARNSEAIQGWSEEERRASFDAFASSIDIETDRPPSGTADCDCFVFPRIDHSLLGTGIVKAVRHYCDGAKPARVLPAKATVFAMAIQWVYPGRAYHLEAMNHLRWSLYPQALELTPEFWTALTAPVQVGEIDFANFAEANWDITLPITAPGTVDALVYWFELELGPARINNAPGSALACIKPAIQYTDAIAVETGHLLNACVRVEENRLCFQTQPPATQARAHTLPTWYVPMLGDQCRNEAYRSAIAKALAAQSAEIVLDIGAGCGLLSMMAAEAGAMQVIGCETHPAILKAGTEIIARNGLANRITLVGKDCRALKVPDDLPRRAELAVFELFDCSLIGEGILHFLAHAREHLLTEKARFLPASARIRAMLIEYRLDRVWDIDANLLNPYRAAPAFINVDAAKLAYRPLTEAFDVFAFNFQAAGPTPEEKALNLPAIAPGTVGAVLFWFDLGLDESTWVSNDPRCADTPHWKQGLQFLPEVQVVAGAPLPLIARHNGSGLKFQWQPDALPTEGLSKIPRFDPRWLAANTELEQQTGGLLQHCNQNPDECTKVAEIAKRFAIEPAAYNLDPTVAQRFASMFLNA